jgi:glycerophosphoryl diester phosphodiesterase
MWNDLPVPIVVGHRGDKLFAPENTLSSFKQAAEKGADAVEFDVKLTADRRVIILHDQTVDRTTNGSGNVAKLTLEAIKKFDAGIQYPGHFPGETIPTLEEVFATVGKRLLMNIELTNYSTPGDGLVSEVVDLVKRHGLEDRILFSSFFPWNLHNAGKLLPNVPRALLTMRGLKGYFGRSFGWHGDYSALNPYMTDVNEGLVSRLHAAGKRVNAWTVTLESDIKRMIGLGVDGIITGDPALTLRLLNRTG